MMREAISVSPDRSDGGADLSQFCDRSGVRQVQDRGLAASTSSLRAQRSNPESLRGKILDCFAALAMTAERTVALSGSARTA
ncbi:hypothetical protein Bdiaspc4_25105 [Bradyrhizobium diazoefficiens]|nr:hypothetical protein CO678_34755 [Bradyrhizobium diazoefficiens]QBP23565.1 hypothetical protein Bdiaspc4_25105 [Bradyrhizobium diazoefficiens]QHP70237.1 hypothetical protein EI171_24850 [Bradyrhizobium sp. LCT2]